MGHERLPRRFLTSWIRNPRPHGRPQFTYGHSLKTLEWAGISTDFAVWSELAQDRPAWRALILATAEYPPGGGGGGGGGGWADVMVLLIPPPEGWAFPGAPEFARQARTNSNSTLTRGGDATRAPHTITCTHCH